MQATARHHEAEARFRALVQESDLPEPDDVDYRPGSVVFFWTGPKVAVAVDLEEHPPP
jgi:hypothetical protein